MGETGRLSKDVVLFCAFTTTPEFIDSGVSFAAWKQEFLSLCRTCGNSRHPEIVVIHHRDGNPSNNHIDNILPVCPNCHALLNLHHHTQS